MKVCQKRFNVFREDISRGCFATSKTYQWPSRGERGILEGIWGFLCRRRRKLSVLQRLFVCIRASAPEKNWVLEVFVILFLFDNCLIFLSSQKVIFCPNAKLFFCLFYNYWYICIHIFFIHFFIVVCMVDTKYFFIKVCIIKNLN